MVDVRRSFCTSRGLFLFRNVQASILILLAKSFDPFWLANEFSSALECNRKTLEQPLNVYQILNRHSRTSWLSPITATVIAISRFSRSLSPSITRLRCLLRPSLRSGKISRYVTGLVWAPCFTVTEAWPGEQSDSNGEWKRRITATRREKKSSLITIELPVGIAS